MIVTKDQDVDLRKFEEALRYRWSVSLKIVNLSVLHLTVSSFLIFTSFFFLRLYGFLSFKIKLIFRVIQKLLF